MSQPSPAVPEYVLTLTCPDAPGIVHAVSRFVMEHGCNISDSQQFGDRDTGLFFMRVHFAARAQPAPRTSCAQEFAASASQFAMDWQIARRDDADADAADGLAGSATA